MTNEKYRYTGPKNSKCPVCGSQKQVAPPVIYLVGNKKIGQHLWCTACFYTVQRMAAMVKNQKDIELLSPSLTKHAIKALGASNIPGEHVVKGFQLMVVPRQGLTLVMEFQHA